MVERSSPSFAELFGAAIREAVCKRVIVITTKLLIDRLLHKIKFTWQCVFLESIAVMMLVTTALSNLFVL